MRLPFRRRRRSSIRLPENRPLHRAQPARPASPARPARATDGSWAGRDTPSAPSEPPLSDEAVIKSDPRRIEDEGYEEPFADVPSPPPSPDEPAPPTAAQTVAAAPEAPAEASQNTSEQTGGRRIALPHALPQQISERLGHTVAATGLTPNMLTVIGLLGSGGAAALAAYGHFWQAGIVMLAAGAFDLLDGAVARATGRATTWGAIFDAVSDRLGEFAMYLGLLVWFSAPAHFDRDAMILIGVAIGGAMLVSYIRSKAGEYGVRVREGLGTRFERVVILAIGLFAGEVVAVLWILAVLTNLTAAQRWGVTWWALRRFEEATAEPEDADQD